MVPASVDGEASSDTFSRSTGTLRGPRMLAPTPSRIGSGTPLLALWSIGGRIRFAPVCRVTLVSERTHRRARSDPEFRRGDTQAVSRLRAGRIPSGHARRPAHPALLGTRGLTGVGSLLMRRISHHVAQHAVCPVLIVPGAVSR